MLNKNTGIALGVVLTVVIPIIVAAISYGRLEAKQEAHYAELDKRLTRIEDRLDKIASFSYAAAPDSLPLAAERLKDVE